MEVVAVTNVLLFRLGLMFCHFSEKDPLRYTTLCHRVKLAGKTGLTGSMVLDIDQVLLQNLSLLQLCYHTVHAAVSVGGAMAGHSESETTLV